MKERNVLMEYSFGGTVFFSSGRIEVMKQTFL